jgi:hypothetical protein
MRARLKDVAFGSMAAGRLVAALWMTPAGDVLAAPSLFARSLTLVAGGALFAGVARLLAGGIG